MTRAIAFAAGLLLGLYGAAWILDRYPRLFPEPFPATETSDGSVRGWWPETTSPAT